MYNKEKTTMANTTKTKATQAPTNTAKTLADFLAVVQSQATEHLKEKRDGASVIFTARQVFKNTATSNPSASATTYTATTSDAQAIRKAWASRPTTSAKPSKADDEQPRTIATFEQVRATLTQAQDDDERKNADQLAKNADQLARLRDQLAKAESNRADLLAKQAQLATARASIEKRAKQAQAQAESQAVRHYLTKTSDGKAQAEKIARANYLTRAELVQAVADKYDGAKQSADLAKAVRQAVRQALKACAPTLAD